jgi:ABC-type lipoprotein export system ATPase subunit
MSVDLRLYALIDPQRANGRDLAQLTRVLVDGGATLVVASHDPAVIATADHVVTLRDGRVVAA